MNRGAVDIRIEAEREASPEGDGSRAERGRLSLPALRPAASRVRHFCPSGNPIHIWIRTPSAGRIRLPAARYAKRSRTCSLPGERIGIDAREWGAADKEQKNWAIQACLRLPVGYSLFLEGYANRRCHRVVELVVMRGRDLEAGSGHQGHAMMNGEAPEDQAGRNESLLLAVGRAPLPEG